jgi:hypothetical protein
MKQSPSLRQFWRSKVQVDGNNYDYSQSESCLRTDLSWQIGLRDHSIQFITVFDKLLSVINDEHRFRIQIQTLDIPENIFLIEYDSLLILKQSMMECLHERFQMFNHVFTDDYERAWNKFLTLIIEYLIKRNNSIKESTDIFTPSTIEQPLHNLNIFFK